MTKLLCALLALAFAGPASVALARAPQTMPCALPSVVQLTRVSAPDSVSTIRHVTATGTTKPSGVALDGRLGTTPVLEAVSMRLSRQIRTAICNGC